jgi:hypothetical protein
MLCEKGLSQRADQRSSVISSFMSSVSVLLKSLPSRAEQFRSSSQIPVALLGAERKQQNETGASDERRAAVEAAHPVIPRHLWFGPIQRLVHRCTSRIACPSGSRTITAREKPNAVSEIAATSGETKRTPPATLVPILTQILPYR